jgi:hypothetical protein
MAKNAVEDECCVEKKNRGQYFEMICQEIPAVAVNRGGDLIVRCLADGNIHDVQSKAFQYLICKNEN